VLGHDRARAERGRRDALQRLNYSDRVGGGDGKRDSGRVSEICATVGRSEVRMVEGGRLAGATPPIWSADGKYVDSRALICSA